MQHGIFGDLANCDKFCAQLVTPCLSLHVHLYNNNFYQVFDTLYLVMVLLSM